MRVVITDGGRAAAGFKGETRDCVTRAVAIATEQDYGLVYALLSEKERASRNTRNRSARKGIHTKRKWFHDYMTSLGYAWTPTMRIGQGCTVHLRDGEIPMRGRLIVSVSRHMVAVIDGVIHDTHDPSRGGTRCVYGYYQRKQS